MSETQAVLDAQRNLEQKRLNSAVTIDKPKGSLEDTLARVQKKFAENPIRPSAGTDPTAQQAKALREAAGIPPRHKHEIPDGESPWHAHLAKLVGILGNGFIVALAGKQGTGKTQMAGALIHAATTRLLTCKYATAMDFFIALKGTFDDGSKQSEAQVIATFVKPKLLVLDECDERSESAWENRLLFHMINQRYNNLVDTLLISRKGDVEFLTSLGDSLASRIQETGGVIVADWPSYREGGR